MLGQIASFMESLKLPYDDVVYRIPYRNLLLMQKDILHAVTGELIIERTGRDLLKMQAKKGIKDGKAPVRKYAEATGKLKEYEQQMQKYQQIIEQMKLSSGIVDESRQITAELNNATDVFVEQQLKVKELDAKVRDLTKSYMDLTAEQKKGSEGSLIMTELSGKIADFNRQNEVLKQLRKSYTDNIKVEGAAADSLVSLRLQLRQLTAEYDRLSQADREANLGK